MEIKDIRRENLVSLCEIHDRKTVAEKMGYADVSYFNQLMAGHSNIGRSTAKKAEKAYNLPEGWMDIRHEDKDPRISSAMLLIRESLKGKSAEKIDSVVEFAQFQAAQKQSEKTQ